MVDTLDKRQARGSVLVVDDDADFSETLGSAIRTHGYKVSYASNGREALDILRFERPSLILSDLSMPIMTGSQLLQALKNDPSLSRIPRVIMTGINDLMIGLKEDAEVLYKPVEEDALLPLLLRHVGPPP